MKKLSLKEIQDIEFKLLCYLADVCEKNGIKYGLTSGTLLGAVRHGGFIPWDDDIDIVMPRDDYNKFIEIVSKTESESIILKTPYNNREYIYEYAKLMDSSTILIEQPDSLRLETHIYIDIFPVDGMPRNKCLQYIHFFIVKKIQLLYAAFKRSNFISKNKRKCVSFWKILAIINSILPQNFLIKILDFFTTLYSYSASKYSAVVTGQWLKEVLIKDEYLLDGHISFNNRLFCTYRTPDLYLRQLYGEYMILPPEEKRKGHDAIAYLRDL